MTGFTPTLFISWYIKQLRQEGGEMRNNYQGGLGGQHNYRAKLWPNQLNISPFLQLLCLSCDLSWPSVPPCSPWTRGSPPALLQNESGVPASLLNIIVYAGKLSFSSVKLVKLYVYINGSISTVINKLPVDSARELDWLSSFTATISLHLMGKGCFINSLKNYMSICMSS